MSSDYNTRHTLIAKIRNQHDDHSWEDFVYFYQRYIYVVIAKMGVNNQDVEDLVQRVLLALWEKLPSFEYEPNKCKFRTWMNQITRNTVIAYFRKQQRYKNDLDRAASIRLNEEDPEQSEPEVYNMAEKEWKNRNVGHKEIVRGQNNSLPKANADAQSAKRMKSF